MKNKRKKEIEDWMNQLQDTIDNIPESGTYLVSQSKTYINNQPSSYEMFYFLIDL